MAARRSSTRSSDSFAGPRLAATPVRLDGTVMLARVSCDSAAGRAVLYACPKAAAPTAGRPMIRATAIFKGLCHEG